MPPEHLTDPVAAAVTHWLRYAQEDLASAQALTTLAHAPPRHAAGLAQQAAEKAIKATLVAEQRPFPFIHDLAKLLDLVPDGWQVRDVDADWSALSRHAVEARYPDDLDDVSPAEAEAAVADAARVVAAVSDQLGPLLHDR